MTVSREQIAAARKADLCEFLRWTHPDRFVRTPHNLFLRENQSLVIHAGYCSYKDYATQETGNDIDFLTGYISIGGVANDATINRISHGIRTVLAVDNDPAGDLCRKRHGNLETIIPTNKDWNEDIQKM